MPNEALTGPANDETPVSTQEIAVSDAQADVEEQQESLEDLKGRLTTQGRQNKAVQTKLANAERALAEAKAELDKRTQLLKEYEDFVYTGKQAPLADQQTYAQRKAAEARAMQNGNVNAATTWQAIAKEENSTVKAALTRMAEAGDFPTKRQIEAIRESLVDVTPEEEQRKPAKVTPANSSGSSSGSLQQSLAEAKKRAQSGDKSAVDEIFRINSQIAAAAARVARG